METCAAESASNAAQSMRCFYPLRAFQHTRTRAVIFDRLATQSPPGTTPIKLRCGRCIGCRLEYSRQWGMRCMHEASMHEANCFITTTYSEANLPETGSLRREHLTKFFKRLRHHIHPFPMKYYACGEYGEETHRAHYHAIIFGWEPPDQKFYKKVNGYNLYISEMLDKIWGLGDCTVGAVTLESAQYVAKYCTKRFSVEGPQYAQLIEETGELIPVEQPYAVMSRRPAIALNWLHKYANDIYAGNRDEIAIEGVKHKPAKFYDKIYDKINHEHMEEIKKLRTEKIEPKTEKELRAHEEITRARIVKKRTI